VHLQARAFQPFFFLLAKFHQKEKLETKVLERNGFGGSELPKMSLIKE
jgi:hypothetical protein